MPNRNPMTQFFVTFPQWLSHSKDSLFEELNHDLPPSSYSTICQETHEDGNPHFHYAIKFISPITKAKMLKFFKLQYPDDYKRIDVQSLKSWPATFQYFDKEDPCRLEKGRIPQQNPPKSKKRSSALQQAYDENELELQETAPLLQKHRSEQNKRDSVYYHSDIQRDYVDQYEKTKLFPSLQNYLDLLVAQVSYLEISDPSNPHLSLLRDQAEFLSDRIFLLQKSQNMTDDNDILS